MSSDFYNYYIIDNRTVINVLLVMMSSVKVFQLYNISMYIAVIIINDIFFYIFLLPPS